MRAPSRFKASDVARALKGAREAGELVVKIEIDHEGKIAMVFDRAGEPKPAGTEPPVGGNEWDSV
jgi:hypothetical protein